MKSSESVFPEFIGNQSALQQLSEDIAAGRFPHALLLEGPTGCGKRTLARLLAKAAVCDSERQRPCGVCAACKKAENGSHPDITVIDEDARTLSVDTVRDLRESAFILPNEAAVRVVILCDAQKMSLGAQNALLKILEEPPRHLRFILTCENRAQLLATIRSRVTVVTLSGVEWDEARPLLHARLPQVDEETLEKAFAVSGGVIGQVLSGFEDDTLRRVLELAPRLCTALTAQNEWDFLALTAQLDKDKPAVTGVLSAMQLVFRDALTLRYGGCATLSTAPDVAKTLSARLSGARLMAMTEALEDLRQCQLRNMNQTLLLTRLCAVLRQAAVG